MPTAAGLTDAELMARLADGDDSALGELMRRWESAIWCFIDRMCRPHACTDDVYQEVWTRVYLYRQRFRPSEPFRPYLFRVAVNCCRTALRRSWPRPASIEAAGRPDEPISADPPPVERMVAAERSWQLRQAVSRLPDGQRTVVLLYLTFAQDYAAIGQLLDIATGTVRSHMHHALRNLRATLSRVAATAESQVDHDRQPNRQSR